MQMWRGRGRWRKLEVNGGAALIFKGELGEDNGQALVQYNRQGKLEELRANGQAQICKLFELNGQARGKRNKVEVNGQTPVFDNPEKFSKVNGYLWWAKGRELRVE